MSKSPLFIPGPASDPAYVNIRSADGEGMEIIRRHCEELWDLFEPYSDAQYTNAIRSNFDARYWEMYLATFFIREGFDITAPKPGPDIGIRYNGCRIWFEATVPERGREGAPDQVPDLRVAMNGEEPIFQEIPNERMILRYLNAISEKKRQHADWLAKGVVAVEDAFVIAINPKRLRHEFADTNPPRILQAAYPIGSPYVVVDSKTAKPLESGYHFRDAIKKASGAVVPTGVFLRSEYTGVSALLCSRVDAANQPSVMGEDFQIVENWRSKAPLPDMFRLKGTFYVIHRRDNGYSAVPDTCNNQKPSPSAY